MSTATTQIDRIADAIIAQSAPLNRTDPSLSITAYATPVIDTADYDSLYTFGDSLVDSGAASRALDAANDFISDDIESVTPTEQGYVAGRFSNGPNYFDRLHQDITGSDVLDYPTFVEAVGERGETGNLPNGSEGGISFAFGGATGISNFGTEIPEPIEDIAPDLESQVNQFDALATRSGTEQFVDDVFGIETDVISISEDALFAFNFGGNDIFEFLDQNPELVFTEAELDAFTAQFTAAYRDAFDELIALGAQNFLIAGAPNAGVAPDPVDDFFEGDLETSIATVQPVTDAMNQGLEALVVEYAATYPEFDFYFFEPDISEPVTNPEAFGLDPGKLTTPFVDDLEAEGSTVTLDDIDSYAFIDDFHPTQAGQELLYEQSLEAERAGTSLDALSNGTGDDDALDGSEVDDVLNGAAGNDTLQGFGGNDIIGGGAGDDTLVGASGDDLLTGGNGNDVLKGGTGDDALSGNGGRDTLFGGFGHDIVNGGVGNDRLWGQRGDDVIDGDAGNDRLVGGQGADTFVFTGFGIPQHDTIVDFDGTQDLIDVSNYKETGMTEADVAALLAEGEQDGTSTTLRFGDGSSVVLENTVLAALSTDDFLFA